MDNNDRVVLLSDYLVVVISCQLTAILHQLAITQYTIISSIIDADASFN
jgi:hypothetical protein